MKKEYTIIEFLEDKIKKEEELKELEERRDRLVNEIEKKREDYSEFVNRFLFRESNIEAKLDFTNMEGEY